MNSMKIRRLDSQQPNFDDDLRALLAWESVSDDAVLSSVIDILRSVRASGDAALLEYSRRFDQLEAASVAELEIPLERLRQAFESIPAAERDALSQAAERIRAFAEHQKLEAWQYTEADGTLLGQQVNPLDRVGLYVPGGKAAYPSSVLMNAIPAIVAGAKKSLLME